MKLQYLTSKLCVVRGDQIRKVINYKKMTDLSNMRQTY